MSNIWKQFQALLPQPARFIATVVSSSGTRSLVRLHSGTELMVNGRGSIGKKVWVVDGSIQSEAPELPYSELTIS